MDARLAVANLLRLSPTYSVMAASREGLQKVLDENVVNPPFRFKMSWTRTRPAASFRQVA